MINSNIYRQLLENTEEAFSLLKEIKNSRVLLTGATGMIGSVMVDYMMLINKKYNTNIYVTAMGRSEKKARELFNEYEDNKYFSFIRGDINCGIPNIGNFDFIIHAASNTHPLAYSQDPVGTITTNVIGTYNLLEYAVQHVPRRFVFLSSVEIYGENRGDVELFSEDYCGYLDCNTVRAGYPEGKRTGESLCCAYESKFDLDVVIPRLCRIYGPTMNWSDSKALSQFIKKAVLEENIVLKSEGNQRYSYLFVIDAVNAIFKIMIDGNKGEAYNVSSLNSNIRIKDLADKLAKIAEREVIYELPNMTELKGYSTATKALMDNEKLKKIGWKEIFDLEKGINLTVDILKEMKAVGRD